MHLQEERKNVKGLTAQPGFLDKENQMYLKIIRFYYQY